MTTLHLLDTGPIYIETQCITTQCNDPINPRICTAPPICSVTVVGNKIVDHSDVVGASPVGAVPNISSFST